MWLLCITTGLASLLYLVNGQCDTGWRYFEGTQSCFQNFHHSGNFFAADKFCQSKNAHLAMLKTREETEFVKALLNADYPTTNEQMSLIGLTATSSDCRKEWLDGSPLNTSVVQMNTNEGTGCMRGEFVYFVLPPAHGNYRENKILADTSVTLVFQRTLCQKAANTYKPPVKKTCDSGWTYYSETKSCYKNFLRPANFEEAKAHCAAFGAYLADIKTKEKQCSSKVSGTQKLSSYHQFTRAVYSSESYALCWKNITVIRKNFVKKIPQRDFRDMPFIGLSAPNKDCDFRWLDGTPLNKSIITFTKFENNPNRCRNDQQCVVFYEVRWWAEPHYLLDDFWCYERPRRLLCKKPLVTEPVEEEVKCLSGWERLEKTNTCVKTRRVSTNSKGNLFRAFRQLLLGTSPRPSIEISKIRECAQNTREKRSSAYNNYCESGKIQKGEHCFWETEKAGSWSTASNDCQKDGGTLFVPHNDREMQNALEFLTEQKPKSDVVWLGLVSTDSWKSLDGSEVDYLRWRPVVNGSGSNSSVTEASLFLYETVSKQDGAFAGYMRTHSVKDSFHGQCSKLAIDAYVPLDQN